jgi:hypothetical protein
MTWIKKAALSLPAGRSIEVELMGVEANRKSIVGVAAKVTRNASTATFRGAFVASQPQIRRVACSTPKEPA